MDKLMVFLKGWVSEKEAAGEPPAKLEGETALGRQTTGGVADAR